MEEEYLELGECKIHYYRRGEGEPIILLHGGGLNAYSAWKDSLTSLSTEGGVYAIDLPGFGESDKPKLNYNTEFFTNLLEDFLNKKGLENVTVVGNSMGGAFAFSLAAETDMVNKLVLVNSYGLSKRFRYYQEPIFILLNIPFVIEEIGWSLQQLVNKHWIEWAFFKWLKTDWGWNKIRTNIIDVKEKIKAPILIVHGSKDLIISSRVAERVCSELNKCKLELMEGCRHRPQKELPNEFNQIVKSFLSER